MYIYESHLGGIYVTEDEMEPEMLYCDECGDSDWLIGRAETREEAYKLLEHDIDRDGSGGYEPEYIGYVLDEYFSCDGRE